MNNNIIIFPSTDESKEEEKMYIGEILKDRMNNLGIDIMKLSDEALIDKEQIQDILDNNVMVSEIDEFDLELISQVLYCKPDYFFNQKIREKDILNASMNRGISDSHVNIVKGKLQQFAIDFNFLRNIENEINKGGN